MKKLLFITISLFLTYASVQGQSVRFSGSNYATVPHANDLRLVDGDFTLEAWIRPDVVNSFGTIATKGGGEIHNTDFFFSITNTGKIGLAINDGTTQNILMSNTSLSTGQWQHVAVSYDRSTQVASFYLNGVADGTSSTSFTPTAKSDTQPFYIGQQGYDCQCNRFVGQIDELRVWDTNLSAGLIKYNSLFSPTGTETDLLVYYQFDEGTGTSANDQTNNNRDATLVNSVSWSNLNAPADSNPYTNYLFFGGDEKGAAVTGFSAGSTSALTVEAVVKTPDSHPVYRSILNFGFDQPLFTVSLNDLVLFVGNEIVLSADFSDYHNKLTHVAFSVDGSVWKLYINGVQVDSGTRTYTNTSSDFAIGYNGTNNGLMGFVTDVRIWNDVRTDSELGDNVFSLLTGSESNLRAYYNFSEGSGTILNDLTSNNYNASFIGNPIWASDVDVFPPAFSSFTSYTLNENSIGNAADYNAFIPGGSADVGINYSLSGTDASYFTLNSSSGLLVLSEPMNFDDPSDADGNNVYDITISATGNSFTNIKDYTISINDVDDCDIDQIPSSNSGLTFSSSAVTEFKQTFKACGTGQLSSLKLLNSDGAASGIIEIEEVTGYNNGVPVGTVIETINATAIAWKNATPILSGPQALRVDLKSSISLSGVTVYDGAEYLIDLSGLNTRTPFGDTGYADGLLYANDNPSQTGSDLFFEVSINESGTNAAPIFYSDAAVSFPENATVVVLDVNAKDESESATRGTPDDYNITYTISGTDASLFSIDSETGDLSFLSPPDFENHLDNDGDGTYELTVTANDGLTTDQSLAITVTDVAEPPVFSSSATLSIEENFAGIVLDVQATAFNGVNADEGLVYTINAIDDGEDFNIDMATGELTFSASPDFELPVDENTDNIYLLTVTATEGTNTATASQVITITVTDNPNDRPPVFTSIPLSSVDDNETYSYEFFAFDPDEDALTFTGTFPDFLSISPSVGGVSTTPFSVDGFNVLPAGHDFDPAGNLIIADDQSRIIKYDPATNRATLFAGALRASNVDNVDPLLAKFNTPSDITIDASGNIYISETFHHLIRKIDGVTHEVTTVAGVLESSGSTNSTNPLQAKFNRPNAIILDSNGDLIVADLLNNRIRKIDISTGEVSTLAGSSRGYADNINPLSAQFNSPRDLVLAPDGNILVAESNNIRKINAITGEVTTLLTTTDGRAAGALTFDKEGNLIYYHDNEIKRVEAGTTTTTIIAGACCGGIVDSTDPLTAQFDEVSNISVDASGNLFISDRNVLRRFSMPGFALSGDAAGQAGSYDITITADDGNGGTTNQSFTLTVNDVTAPTLNSATEVSISENVVGTIPTPYTIQADDSNANNSGFTYELASGANDNSLFTLTGDEIVFTSSTAPDFESPLDSDENNDYLLQFTITDGTGNESEVFDVTITVTNVNEPITYVEGNMNDILENSLLATDIQATDEVGLPLDQGLTYAITDNSGDMADGNLFNIDPATGVVEFNVAPDFENPQNVGGTSNTYQLFVSIADADFTITETVQIVVMNADEFTPPAQGLPDWNDPSSWEGGQIPGEDDDISLPAGITIMVDDIQAVKNLNVEANTTVEITNGGALAIFGEYFGEGDVEQTREITGTSLGGYSIIGSPMTITPDVSTLPVVVYEYDVNSGFIAKTSGSLEPGRGYFLRESLPDGIPLDLALGGEPNTGDIKVSVTSDGDTYNLLSNPYTAAISVVDFIETNEVNIDGTLYLWDDGGANTGALRGGDYLAVNKMGITGVFNTGGFTGGTGSGAFDMNIGSLQGFFVSALSDSEVTFSQDMQVTTSASNAVFFRVDDQHNESLPQTVKLQLSNGELSNIILVGLADGASESHDHGYDSEKLVGNEEISFYAWRDNTQLAIEGLGMIEEGEEAVFDLRYDLTNGDDYFIKLTETMNLDRNMEVLLHDNVTDQLYNLLESTTVNFATGAGNLQNRFDLIFQRKAAVLGEANIVSAFTMYGTTEQLHLSFPSEVTEAVSIFDLSGRTISEQQIQFVGGKATMEVDLKSQQIYLITIEDQSIKFLIKE